MENKITMDTERQLKFSNIFWAHSLGIISYEDALSRLLLLMHCDVDSHNLN